LAGKLGLPFHLKELHLHKSISENAARTARLGALAHIARELRRRRTPCHGVVMAHHADDQAETVLMRIFRGCGLDGLSAMSAESRIGDLMILRPLLHVRRLELRDYLSDIGQSWREDRTNATGQYLRNRIRNELLPRIELLYPQAVASLVRLAHVAAEAHGVITAAAEKAILHVAAPRKKSLTLPRRALRRAPAAVATEVLRRLIAAVPGSTRVADFERLDQALHLARGNEGQKQVELGGGLVLTVRGGADGTVILTHATRPPRKQRGRR
jgi:tRNA(Ile)-lysidine synthase